MVTFDARGTVQEIKRVGEDQAQDVTMVAARDPDPGNDRTLLQALFGNVGRFGPGGGLPTGAAAAPGGGSGSGIAR